MRILFSISLFSLLLTVKAQKPVIELSSSIGEGQWPSVSYGFISHNGLYATHVIYNMPQGSCRLVLQSTSDDWKRTFISQEVVNISFTQDSKHLLFLAGDSLIILSTDKDDSTIIPGVQSYKLIQRTGGEWLTYLVKDSSRKLIIKDLKSGDTKIYKDVLSYDFSKTNETMLLILKAGQDLNVQRIQLVSMSNNDTLNIWQGSRIYQHAFSGSGNQLAFIASSIEKKNINSLWYYNGLSKPASLLVADGNPGIDSDLFVDRAKPTFSLNGERIFFQLKEKQLPKTDPGAAAVDVWNYKDETLQSDQLLNDIQPRFLQAVVSVQGGQVVQLQKRHEVIVYGHTGKDDRSIVYLDKGDEGWWNQRVRSAIYLQSTIDGTRKMIRSGLTASPFANYFKFSPTGEWMLFFDFEKKAWFCYNLKTGKECNITQDIPYPVYKEDTYEFHPLPSYITAEAVGAEGWFDEDRALIVYDDYDIWQVDPGGEKKPINITRGYGRAHAIKFRLIKFNNGDGIVKKGDTLILTAFDTRSKNNGFFRIVLSAHKDPELLSMDPYITYVDRSQMHSDARAPETYLVKAKDTDTWIALRKSDTAAPNFYITRDFANFKVLSNVQPQKKFNWLKSELLHWRTLDGNITDGILYKPENFNPKNKYPVIFNPYQYSSDDLLDYPAPQYTLAQINVAYFVSRGYLVFIPDIHYKMGHPGESALNSIIPAFRYLAHFPFVDSNHIGIDGHSFGGFETNYVVSHCNLFAAAVASAGPTDYISGYNGLMYGFGGTGSSMQFHFETSQSRIGATLWQRPELFLENSPVLRADKIKTPLLMMHNKKDGLVQFSQATELFTALRRLGKRVWLLQYDNGAHLLYDKDAKDYTIRITQFFDHYLKGAAAPIWMTEGVPARWKGIKNGLELDESGKNP